MTDVSLRSELVLEPRSAELDPNDSRWLEAVASLVSDVNSALRDHDARLELRETPTPDTKGSTAEIIVAVGTSGAIGALLAAFRAWLEGGRSREVVVRRRDGKVVTELSVKAVGISEGEVLKQLQAAFAIRPEQ